LTGKVGEERNKDQVDVPQKAGRSTSVESWEARPRKRISRKGGSLTGVGHDEIGSVRKKPGGGLGKTERSYHLRSIQ